MGIMVTIVIRNLYYVS